jgi:hypothetical protein
MKIVFMKTRILSTLVLTMSLIACKKGDMGPEGPQGSQGPQGPQGQSGSTAVKYSNWIVVKEGNWTQTDFQAYASTYTTYTSSAGWGHKSGLDTVITYKTEIPTPQVTQGVLDSGIVMYYIKDSSSLYGGAVRNFDVYSAWNDWYETGVTNRLKEETNDYRSHFWIHADSDTIPKGKLTLYTQWEGGARYYDTAAIYDYPYMEWKQKYTELKPKTQFYVRYVIIPGGSAIGGRKAPLPVDVKNYEAVKAYYRIKD